MNRYEQKQEDRRQRLAEAAERLQTKALQGFDGAMRELDGIPPGQPILVGHHSERRHRRALERHDAKMRASSATMQRAKDLASRALSVGDGGISSDDPDAIQKLQEKALDLGRVLEMRKAVNREWRRAGMPGPENSEGWGRVGSVLGLSAEKLAEVVEQQARGVKFSRDSTPFPGYSISNMSAQLRSTMKRIEQLSRLRATPARDPIHGDGWQLFEDVDENRVVLHFDDRIGGDKVAALKMRGFRWSPSRQSWMRKRSRDAWDAALRVVLPAEEG